jgi:hypothetical protein
MAAVNGLLPIEVFSLKDVTPVRPGRERGIQSTKLSITSENLLLQSCAERRRNACNCVYARSR